MKRFIIYAVSALLATTAFAKDIKTLIVTTSPQMHCDNCEKKIKGNLRFVKGVTKIQTDRTQQQVTVTYDADKTTPELIVTAFNKFGYTAQPVKGPAASQQDKKSK